MAHLASILQCILLLNLIFAINSFEFEGDECTRLRKLQVVFLVDGSLPNGTNWSIIQTEITKEVAKLSQKKHLPSVEYGLVSYHNWKGDGSKTKCYTLLQPLSSNPNEILSKLSKFPGEAGTDLLKSECSLSIAVLVTVKDQNILWETKEDDTIKKIIIAYTLKPSIIKLDGNTNRRDPIGDGSDTCENSNPPTASILRKVIEENKVLLVLQVFLPNGREEIVRESYSNKEKSPFHKFTNEEICLQYYGRENSVTASSAYWMSGTLSNDVAKNETVAAKDNSSNLEVGLGFREEDVAPEDLQKRAKYLFTKCLLKRICFSSEKKRSTKYKGRSGGKHSQPSRTSDSSEETFALDENSPPQTHVTKYEQIQIQKSNQAPPPPPPYAVMQPSSQSQVKKIEIQTVQSAQSPPPAPIASPSRVSQYEIQIQNANALQGRSQHAPPGITPPPRAQVSKQTRIEIKNSNGAPPPQYAALPPPPPSSITIVHSPPPPPHAPVPSSPSASISIKTSPSHNSGNPPRGPGAPPQGPGNPPYSPGMPSPQSPGNPSTISIVSPVNGPPFPPPHPPPFSVVLSPGGPPFPPAPPPPFSVVPPPPGVPPFPFQPPLIPLVPQPHPGLVPALAPPPAIHLSIYSPPPAPPVPIYPPQPYPVYIPAPPPMMPPQVPQTPQYNPIMPPSAPGAPTHHHWMPPSGPGAPQHDHWMPPSGPGAPQHDHWMPPSGPVAPPHDHMVPPAVPAAPAHHHITPESDQPHKHPPMMPPSDQADPPNHHHHIVPPPEPPSDITPSHSPYLPQGRNFGKKHRPKPPPVSDSDEDGFIPDTKKPPVSVTRIAPPPTLPPTAVGPPPSPPRCFTKIFPRCFTKVFPAPYPATPAPNHIRPDFSGRSFSAVHSEEVEKLEEACNLDDSELPNVQILFLVDGSLAHGSNWTIISQDMTKEISRLIQEKLQRSGSYVEFAVASYFSSHGDEASGGKCYSLLQPFTNDPQSITQKIGELGHSHTDVYAECSLTLALILAIKDNNLQWNNDLITVETKATRKFIIVYPMRVSSTTASGAKREPHGDGTDTCENSKPPKAETLKQVVYNNNVYVLLGTFLLQGKEDQVGKFYSSDRSSPFRWFAEDTVCSMYFATQNSVTGHGRFWKMSNKKSVSTEPYKFSTNVGMGFKEDTIYKEDVIKRAKLLYLNCFLPEFIACDWEDPPGYNTLGL